LNLREEDNLSTKDTTAEFILSSKRPLFRGFTVLFNDVLITRRVQLLTHVHGAVVCVCILCFCYSKAHALQGLNN